MTNITVKQIIEKINSHPDGGLCDFCLKPIPVPKQFYTITFDEDEIPSVTLYCKACSYKVIQN